MKVVNYIDDYRAYVLDHFGYETTCEIPQIMTQMHLAKEKIRNWIGDENFDKCVCVRTKEFDIINYIFELTYYYTTADYGEDLHKLELTVYLKLKNNGLIIL